MNAHFTTGRAPASQRIAVSAALTLMASTGGPLSAATLGQDGTFSYNVTSVPLIAEAAKLLMSVICLVINAASDMSGISEGKTESLDTGTADGNSADCDGNTADSETSACLRDVRKPHESKPAGEKTQSESCQEAFLTGGGGVAGLALIANNLREELRQVTWRSALIYFPPSMLFIVINNLRICNLQYMDPASSGLLGTLRVSLTAVMLRCFLQRSFTRTQWASVALLSLSVALSKMDGARFKLVGDPKVSTKRWSWLSRIRFSLIFSSSPAFYRILRKVCQVSALTFSSLTNNNPNRAHINNRDSWAWPSWLAARHQPLCTWSGPSRGASPRRCISKMRRSTDGGSCSTASLTSRLH